jgi:hypothetical protein
MHVGRDRCGGDACLNLGTTLVGLNRLPLQLSRLLASPDLILTLLGEELPGIAASNRCAANVIDGDRDTAVGEVRGPPFTGAGKSSSSTDNAMSPMGGSTST